MESAVYFEFERDFELLTQDESHIEEITARIRENLVKDIEKSEKIIDRLLEVTAANGQKMANARAKYLRSICLTEKMQYAQSIMYAKQAYEYFSRTENTPATIEACNEIMLSSMLSELYVEAINWGNFALEMCEKEQEYRYTFITGVNLAYAYERLGEYKEANEMLRRLESLQAEGTDMHRFALWINMAHNEISLDNLKEAERLVEKCTVAASGGGYEWDVPELEWIKGRIHAKKYQFYSADEAFSRAVRESENTGNLSLIPEILIDWGELEIKRYRYDEAKQRFLDAKEALSEESSGRKLQQIYTGLAKVEKKQNNYKEAYEYFIRAQELFDMENEKNSHIYIAGMKIKQAERHTRFIRNMTRELRDLAEIGKAVISDVNSDKILNTVNCEICRYMNADDLTVEFAQTRDKLSSQSSVQARSSISARVMAGERELGILRLRRNREKAFSSGDYKKLRIIASYVGIAMENSRFLEATRYAADHDFLTGILTRERIMSIAEKACRDFAHRGGKGPLSIAIADIDHFKAINDSCGHLSGDHVIVDAARILKKEFTESAFCARYGGEEFLILLPDKSLDQAVSLAQAARKAIMDSCVTAEDGRTIRYTASFGVYEFTADASDLDHGIRQVDEMLYRAKQNGRNRVEYNGDIKY